MQSVYALLVGIATYPKGVTSLYGCEHDVRDIDALFAEIFTTENNYKYQPLLLIGSQAKRNNIIGAFTHFYPAKEKDICILYYSGHGSRVKTDRKFWADGSEKLESLVCYDSRLPHGYDLVDKELSYLIWRATHNKPAVHFVSIMDCCFSGHNTKGLQEIQKMYAANDNVRPVEEFEGYQHYKNGTPPRGNYIAISASQQNEPSVEKFISDDYRGVFTFSFTNTIRHAKEPFTYRSLMEQVSVKTLSLAQQTPAIDAVGTNLDTGIFGQITAPPQPACLLYFKTQWKINRGSVHEISVGDKLGLRNGKEVTVLNTAINESEVSVPEGLDNNEMYKVYPNKKIARSLRFFNAIENKELNRVLLDELNAGRYQGIDFAESEHNADFTIRSTDEKCFVLTEPGSDFPLFERVFQHNPSLFLRRLEHVAAWASVVNLFNIEGQELIRYINPSLYKVNENGKLDDQLPARKIKLTGSDEFDYILKYDQKLNPSFRLEIKNTYTSEVFISILYCSSDFSVTDLLLPNTLLDVNSTVWAQYKNRLGHVTRSIPVLIDEKYYTNGRYKIKDYLVIIASELPIDSSIFRMNSLPLNLPGLRLSSKSIAPLDFPGPAEIKEPVWSTIKIPLVITYPTLTSP